MNITYTEEKQSEKRVTAKRHLGPFFVLLVLAPVMAELLLGDVPLNVSLPVLMILNLSYYGTGALIMRELCVGEDSVGHGYRYWPLRMV